MNKKRELYRRIRDTGLCVITLEEIEKLNEKKPRLADNRQALHRLIERLRIDELLVRRGGGIYSISDFMISETRRVQW